MKFKKLLNCMNDETLIEVIESKYKSVAFEGEVQTMIMGKYRELEDATVLMVDGKSKNNEGAVYILVRKGQ